MKRLYIIIIALWEYLDIFAQSVYMHEAQCEAEESDGISLWDICATLFLIGVIYIIYKIIVDIKQNRDDKKKRIEERYIETVKKEKEEAAKRAYLESDLDPEAIDLGISLPILWSSINVGAKRNNIQGLYYAWADINSSLRFGHKKNELCDVKFEELCRIFNSEKGEFSGAERFDVAHIYFGDSWRVPTENEFRCLVEECTWELVKEGLSYGWNVTGPNGNHIFIPMEFVAHRMIPIHFTLTEYWTSTPTANNDVQIYPPDLTTLKAIMLDIDQPQESKTANAHFIERYRVENGFIRPVKNKS